MTEIQAAVCREFGAPLAVEALRLLPPAPRQVHIRVAACAICHSDILFMDGAWGGAPPLVPGHEVAGQVSAAGADSGYREGDRVVATLIRSCGECGLCARGAPALCENSGALAPEPLQDARGHSVTAMMSVGGFAQQIVVDKSQVAPITTDMSDAEASLLACGVLTGWGAVRNIAPPPSGASVAVVGCGGVGLNCLQAAGHAGAAPLCAIDLHEEKLQLARGFGASCVARAGRADSAVQARAHTGGAGFDFVYMAAGGARAVEFAAELLAPLGALVLAGMQANEDLPALNTTAIAHYQQRVLGCKMGGASMADIDQLAKLHQAGRLRLRELIADFYPLERVNDAVAAARTGNALKSVVVPQKD